MKQFEINIMNNIIVEVPLISDLKEIVDVEIDGEEQYRKESENIIKNLIKNKRIFVCKSENKIVGYLSWVNNFMAREDFYYFEQIRIDSKYRKLGFASYLIKYFLDYAKNNNIRKIFGDIHKKNVASLNLCLKLGAVKSGIITGIDPNGEEKIIIRFDLE